MNPLARAVYNIVAEGGDDVLRAAGRAAKKIDPRTAKEAVKRVADDVVEAADDWGWKGGRPGEITSKDYWKERDIIEKMGDTAAAEVRLGKLDNKVIEQFSKSKYPHIRGDEYSWSREQGPDEMMRMFASIEEAGVPRKWSGRFAEVTLKGDSYYDYSMIEKMADHMKSMTDAQRKTYLDTVEKITESWGELLPGETSEETGRFVAEAAKAAQELTPSQLEEYWALLPEWTESLEDLSNAVRML